MNRHLQVVFSKTSHGNPEYVEIARGTWVLGREPELTGEAIPPEVLKGMEKQTPVACSHPSGTITYARADVKYAMDFKSE